MTACHFWLLLSGSPHYTVLQTNVLFLTEYLYTGNTLLHKEYHIPKKMSIITFFCNKSIYKLQKQWYNI